MTDSQALRFIEALFGLAGLSLVAWSVNGWAALGVFFCMWSQGITLERRLKEGE